MIRKVYLDQIRNRLSKKDFKWAFGRGWQYCLIHLSYLTGRALCGPLLGTLVVNYDCNYRCKMCDLPAMGERLKSRGLKELSTGELKEVLRDFAGLGISGVGFTGGEPFLRSDLFEILAYAKSLGMTGNLSTNGSMLNPENALKLVDTGIDSLSISMDAANSHVHDAIRGHKGAFESAVSAVNNVNAARRKKNSPLRLKLASVVSPNNVDGVEDLYRIAIDLGVDCLEFIPEQRFASFPGGAGTLAADNAFQGKLKQVIGRLVELKKEKPKIENSFRHLKLFEKSFRGTKSPLACYAGYSSYTVDCYGEIYPCLPWLNWGKPSGNIRDDGLKEFWYSGRFNKLRSDIARCRDCYLNCQTELNLLFNF